VALDLHAELRGVVAAFDAAASGRSKISVSTPIAASLSTFTRSRPCRTNGGMLGVRCLT